MTSSSETKKKVDFTDRTMLPKTELVSLSVSKLTGNA